jgi:hypothetical protein
LHPIASTTKNSSTDDFGCPDIYFYVSPPL